MTVCWTDKGGDSPPQAPNIVSVLGEALARLGASLFSLRNIEAPTNWRGSFEFPRHDPSAAQSNRLRCRCCIHGAMRQGLPRAFLQRHATRAAKAEKFSVTIADPSKPLMDRELVLRRRCGASLPIPARVYFQRHIRTNDLKSLGGSSGRSTPRRR